MNFTNTTPNKTNDNVAPERGRVCHRPVDRRQCDRRAATTDRPHGSSGGRTVSTRPERAKHQRAFKITSSVLADDYWRPRH